MTVVCVITFYGILGKIRMRIAESVASAVKPAGGNSSQIFSEIDRGLFAGKSKPTENNIEEGLQIYVNRSVCIEYRRFVWLLADH